MERPASRIFEERKSARRVPGAEDRRKDEAEGITPYVYSLKELGGELR
jgi:hypothetical protein